MRRFGNRKALDIPFFTVAALLALSVGGTRAESQYGEGSEKYPKGPFGPVSPPPAEEAPGIQATEPASVDPARPAVESAPAGSPLAKPGAAIIKVTPSAASVGRYKTLSVAIELNTPYSNPFDQEDIKVDMRLTGPAGEAIVQPCFYKSGTSANSAWEARFAPRRTGAFAFRIAVIRGGATEESGEFRFQADESASDGFLHMDPDSWYGLRFDSGRRFRGVGENFGWEGGNYNFRNTLPLLKSNKVNFIRTWEGPGRFGLEHNQGFNRYSSAVADKIDTVMQLAEQNGIYIMAAFDPHIYYATKADYWAPGIIRWNENPYSTSHGGPCAKPSEFFTNAKAKAAYRNRLRYTVARWGSNPYAAVWEFWNEVDHLVAGEGVTTASLGEWHKEMSAYLRSIDPNSHVITTSLSHNDYKEIWSLPGIEFSQRHLYGGTDGLPGTFSQYENSYKKPFVSGEFSLHWTGTTATTPAAYERELHMALFRGMFLQTPILPMTWWWDFHADQGDYFHFARAADMVSRMVDGDGKLEKLAFSAGGELEVMALKGPLGSFLWVRNKQNYAVNGASVTLNGVAELTYDVRAYDTWTGVFSAPQTQPAAGGSLKVTLPNLGADKEAAYWLAARIPVQADSRYSKAGSRLTLSRIRQEGNRLEIALAGADGAPVSITLSDLRGRVLFRRRLEARAVSGPILDHSVILPGLVTGIHVLGIEQGGAALRRPIFLK